MVDRIEAMRMLLLAVDTGSMSAAGRALRVPLPTLSRKLSELEALLGARLLVRSTRALTLTDAGVAYVAAARGILEQLDEAERAAAGEFVAPRGELALTAPILFGRLHVLPIVAEFLAAYPDISVRLALSDRTVNLVDEHLDMAVRLGALPDSSMVATRVGTMRTVIVASPAVVARHGEPTTASAVSALPCVGFDASTPATTWVLRQPGGRGPIAVAVQPRLSVSTAEAAVDAAVAGVGITRVLHYQAAAAIGRGELGIIMAAFEPEPLSVHLVHAGRGRMPLKMRLFLDVAAARLKARLAALAGDG